jgi:hypothetical protein
MALLRTRAVPLRQHFQKKRSSNLYLHFPSSYSFLSLYVTLRVVVVRDTSNAEMIYNAAKLVRLFSRRFTDYST